MKPYHTPEGKLKVLYLHQLGRSRVRKHKPPTYTKEWLVAKYLTTSLYKLLYKDWENSGYSKDLAPSIDRIDNNIGYTEDNIRLVTWKQNRELFYRDCREATNGAFCKPVSKYTLTGNLIQTYPSIQHAVIANVKSRASIISQCCKHRRLSSGGFRWSYEENPLPKLSKEDAVRVGLSEVVIDQIGVEGAVIATYDSMSEASRITGIDASAISKVCKGVLKQTGGYRWVYTGEPPKEITPRQPPKKEVYMLDLLTGKVLKRFESIDLAAEKTSRLKSAILRVCHEVQVSCGEYRWSYENKDQKPLTKRQLAGIGKQKKIVNQYCKQTGKLLSTYPSIRQASEESGIPKTSLRAMCLGMYKLETKFRWECK